MVIEVKDGETGNNPYRTGRIVGITKEARERLGVESNVCYMEQSVFSKMFNDISDNNETDI